MRYGSSSNFTTYIRLLHKTHDKLENNAIKVVQGTNKATYINTVWQYHTGVC